MPYVPAPQSLALTVRSLLVADCQLQSRPEHNSVSLDMNYYSLAATTKWSIDAIYYIGGRRLGVYRRVREALLSAVYSCKPVRAISRYIRPFFILI